MVTDSKYLVVVAEISMADPFLKPQSNYLFISYLVYIYIYIFCQHG